MQILIQSWFKYFIFAGVFGFCINLIYLAAPVYIMVICDRVLFSFSRATLYALSAGIGISLVTITLLQYFRRRMMEQAGTSLVEKMQPRVLQSMHQGALEQDGPGYFRGFEDLEILRNAVTRGDVLAILDLPWIILYLSVLYFIHPMVGLAAMGAVILMASAQTLLKIFEKKRYIIADVAFESNLGFIRTVLAKTQIVSGMGMLPAVMKRYITRDQKASALRREADGFHSFVGSFIRLVHFIATLGVFGAGAFVFFEEEITIGAIFASVIMVFRIISPFERGLYGMKTACEASGAYKRLKHLVPMRTDKPKFVLPEPKGKLAVDGVSYAVKGMTILSNIKFALEPGEILGVFGPSSAGKTTLLRLILGICPPLAGKIRLDGAEIAHWPQDELGKYVGYLPQESDLLPVSVAENIARLGEVDSEKVVEAAKNAGAHEMIVRLPNGYDTRISQNMTNLAAGQRRLISLARALYGNPKLVVLDGPHAHLDDMGFRQFVGALNHLKQAGVTTILVTDRTNLLLGTHKMLVIKEGQVAMFGPSKDVLTKLSGGQQTQQAAGV